jgi:putative resolvase
LETQADVTISIAEAAKELGVSTKTLRRWTDTGKIKFERSPTGQRRFYLSDLKQNNPRDLNQSDARLYGARSHKNQKLIHGIAKAVKDVNECS